MRVLITGGSGFIARYLATALSAKGHELTILDLRPSTLAVAHRAVVGDVRNPDAVDAAMGDVDCIYHLAAAHHDHGLADETYFSVNEEGTRVMADAAARHGINRFCFYSSCAVYGTAPEPRDESTKEEPASPYGASKLAGERVLEAWAAANPSRRVLVVRPTVVFGPGNVANMYSLIRQIDSGLFARVGPGRNRKSMAYVENLVAATLHLTDPWPEASVSRYNYVDKPDLTSAQICETISAALGRGAGLRIPLGLAMSAAMPFDAAARLLRRNFPISRARILKLASSETTFDSGRILKDGFKPGIDLRDGLRRMVEWYGHAGRSLNPTPSLPSAEVVSEFRLTDFAPG